MILGCPGIFSIIVLTTFFYRSSIASVVVAKCKTFVIAYIIFSVDVGFKSSCRFGRSLIFVVYAVMARYIPKCRPEGEVEVDSRQCRKDWATFDIEISVVIVGSA